MGSVQVALVGPSAAAVQARLREIASAVKADASPFIVTAGFETGGPVALHSATSALLEQSLSDDELTAKLVPFQDETVDPQVGVRFIVSPENTNAPPG